MAEEIRDVTVRLKVDTKDVELQESKVKKAFDQTNTAINEQLNLTGKQRATLERLIELRNTAFRIGKKQNKFAIRALDEEIAALKKAGTQTEKLGKETEKLNKKSGNLVGTFRKIGVALGVAFAARTLINFGKQLNQTAIEMEAFRRRAEIVFGDSIDIIKEFAKENALALGFTENEFLGAAAAIGDLIIPLAATEEKAAEMSTQLLKTAASLKVFQGSEKSVQEISDILTNSLAGRVVGLRQLQINIDRTSEEFKDLVEVKMEDDGATKSQAKSLAIYDMILEQSNDAIVSFEENTNSLAQSQAELGANVRTLTEELALLLTPAFALATEAILKQIEFVNDSSSNLEKLTKILQFFSPVTTAATLANNFFNKSQEDTIDIIGALFLLTDDLNNLTKEEIRNLFLVKKEIEDLVKERATQNVTLQRTAQINQELIPLQEEMNRLLGKQKEEVEEVDDAWKKLNKRLKQDFREALRSAGDGLDELGDEFDSIMQDLEDFGERIDEINQLAILRFESIILRSELAGAGVETLSAIQQRATDKRIEQLETLGLSEEAFAEQSKRIREEGEATQKALFLFQKSLAAITVILELQKEIAIIGATPIPAPIKAAQILNARLRAATSLVTIAGSTIAGFAEGTEDAPGGLAMVGERGKELTYLPQGAKVLPNDKTEKYAGVIDSMFRNKFDQYIMERYIPDMVMTSTETPTYNDHRLRGDVRNSRFNRGDAEAIGRAVAKHTSRQQKYIKWYA